MSDFTSQLIGLSVAHIAHITRHRTPTRLESDLSDSDDLNSRKTFINWVQLWSTIVAKLIIFRREFFDQLPISAIQMRLNHCNKYGSDWSQTKLIYDIFSPISHIIVECSPPTVLSLMGSHFNFMP